MRDGFRFALPILRLFVVTMMCKLILFIIAAAVTGLAHASGTEPATFRVSEDADFAHFREPLAAYLHKHHASRAADVCILGERSADGTKWAWVIWPAGKVMILWDGGTSSMLSSRRVLDLKKDVVATEAEVAGSTYLVTKAWVSKQQTRCDTYGIQAKVSESKPSR